MIALATMPAPLLAEPLPAPSKVSLPGQGVVTARRYAAEIARAAQRFDVDPAWIRAVIERESAYDPHAVSHAGAQGLMQVMPQTYAILAGRHGLGTDPFRPADNIMAGAAYLREMHDLFGEPGVFAAYNAGPGRYRNHLETGRPLPRETRDYVRRVLSSLARDGAATPFQDQRSGGVGHVEMASPTGPAATDRLFVDRTRARTAFTPRPVVSASADQP